MKSSLAESGCESTAIRRKDAVMLWKPARVPADMQLEMMPEPGMASPRRYSTLFATTTWHVDRVGCDAIRLNLDSNDAVMVTADNPTASDMPDTSIETAGALMDWRQFQPAPLPPNAKPLAHAAIAAPADEATLVQKDKL